VPPTQFALRPALVLPLAPSPPSPAVFRPLPAASPAPPPSSPPLPPWPDLAAAFTSFPLPAHSGRSALLLGHGRGNERFEPSLPPEPARVFVEPSKALRSAHAPMAGRVTATGAGIAVRAVVSSKRASGAVSDISGRIVANGVVSSLVSSTSPETARVDLKGFAPDQTCASWCSRLPALRLNDRRWGLPLALISPLSRRNFLRYFAEKGPKFRENFAKFRLGSGVAPPSRGG